VAGNGGEPNGDVTRVEQVSHVRTVAYTFERVLEREPNAMNLILEARSETFQQREPLQRGDALSRWRHLEHVDTPVGAAKRLHPMRLVGGQVVLAHPARRRDRGCDPTSVERTRAVERDLAEGVGEVGLT
jgi:hypothetical protein